MHPYARSGCHANSARYANCATAVCTYYPSYANSADLRYRTAGNERSKYNKSETDGKARSHSAGETAQFGPGGPTPRLAAAGPTPLGQGGGSAAGGAAPPRQPRGAAAAGVGKATPAVPQPILKRNIGILLSLKK